VEAANQKWKDVLQHRGLPLHDNSTDTNSSSPLHSPAANRTPVHPSPNGHANDASVGRQRGSRTSLVQQQSRQKFFHIPHRWHWHVPHVHLKRLAAVAEWTAGAASDVAEWGEGAVSDLGDLSKDFVDGFVDFVKNAGAAIVGFAKCAIDIPYKPIIKIRDFKASGGVCGLKISFKATVGINAFCQRPRKDFVVEIDFDPADMGKKLIDMALSVFDTLQDVFSIGEQLYLLQNEPGEAGRSASALLQESRLPESKAILSQLEQLRDEQHQRRRRQQQQQ